MADELVERAQRAYANEIIRQRVPDTELPRTPDDAEAFLTTLNVMHTHMRHANAERHERMRESVIEQLATAANGPLREALQDQLEQLRVIDERRNERRRQRHRRRELPDRHEPRDWLDEQRGRVELPQWERERLQVDAERLQARREARALRRQLMAAAQAEA